MSEDQKKQLEQQLWNIANTLRGKMNADQFRDYILGFIFYKYLSEKMHLYADEILQQDRIKYLDIKKIPRKVNILNLLLSVINVSGQTVEIVNSLPIVNF
jgi:type I restriction-modification system DNA methylase subunit